ncbi:MAG TPA: cytochrome B, partial [Gammaproteobacteria bacterium]|nr:cytochrome B [Gammaproteobacteria bacterium]
MPLKNSADRYGSVTRFLHWAVFVLFVCQYVGANIMTNLARDKTLFGLTQGDYYNWHKSIGLVLLGLALARLIWRKTTPLPDWAPVLSPAERVFSHWNEVRLYWCMFLLPLSGYLFVMAGGFGVKLFGLYDLPNPIGK